jgi:hypothetical protein
MKRKRGLLDDLVMAYLDFHQSTARHVLEHEEQGICIGDRDGFVQVYQLLVS